MSITIAPQTILIFVGLARLTWAIVSVGGTLQVILFAIFRRWCSRPWSTPPRSG
jgi:hypothetical protein